MVPLQPLAAVAAELFPLIGFFFYRSSREKHELTVAVKASYIANRQNAK